MNTRLSLSCAAIALVSLATPALAGDNYPAPPPAPMPAFPPQPGLADGPAPVPGQMSPEYDRARTDWINECVSRRMDERRSGNGGAVGGVIGAVVGGVAGNRIAGHGDRLAGTLIGGGAGGLAGAAIGSSIDKHNRNRAEDDAPAWCEDYLARNTAQQPGYGYGYGQGYPMSYPYQGGPYGGGPYMAAYPMAYAYGPPMMMQPVMVPVQHCHEVVERPVYRTITVRRVVYDKRIRMAPTKLVKTTKYVKSAK